MDNINTFHLFILNINKDTVKCNWNDEPIIDYDAIEYLCDTRSSQPHITYKYSKNKKLLEPPCFWYKAYHLCDVATEEEFKRMLKLKSFI